MHSSSSGEHVTEEKGKWTVLLHGGAGGIVDADVLPEVERQMLAALQSCFSAISKGENGLAVVVAGLAVLEASQYFDAGYGAFPRGNRVQLDVSLIDGTGRFYAIAGIERIVHPSRLALHMLTQGTSMFRWFDQGFAAEIGTFSTELQQWLGMRESDAEMIAPFARESLAHALANRTLLEKGTVGCLVRNPNGELFAGTSTGGTPSAPLGRIGDSPVIGAGSFAYNEIAALSATGKGEALLACSTVAFAAARIAQIRRSNRNIDTAELSAILAEEIERTQRRFPGVQPGLIALTPEGCPGVAFTSEMLPCAVGRGDKSPEQKFVSNFGLLNCGLQW